MADAGTGAEARCCRCVCRGAGIAGGKFLERQKVYKPRSEEIYTYLDFYVGGTIEVFNRTFELFEADE